MCPYHISSQSYLPCTPVRSISRQLRWLITVVVITSYTWFNYLMIDEEAEMFFDYWFVYFGWKQHRRFYKGSCLVPIEPIIDLFKLSCYVVKGEDLAQNPEMDATFSANLPTKSQTGRDVPVV